MRCLLLVFVICAAVSAQCSLESVHGTWAYQSRGTAMVIPPGGSIPEPVGFVGMGIEKIDYDGDFTVNGLVNLGGMVQPVKVSGTIVVDAGCTATDSYIVAGVTRTDRLVILDNGNEMRMMGTDGGGAGIAEFRRLSWTDAQCGVEMLHGVYSGAADGTLRSVPQGQSQAVTMPFSMILSSTLQWDGTGSGTSTMSIGGNIVNYPFPQISTKLNADCTGTVNWKGPKGSDGSGTDYIILLNNGREMWTMVTQNTAGTSVMLGRMKRTSMTPIAPKW